MATLAGCASKKPMIDSSTLAAPAGSDAALTSAPVNTDDSSSGVQTVKHHRFLGIFSPYRIDIQQGNFVSREMLVQVKEGMTREQVRFALGTPLLTDIFHADRWDYVFRLQKGNGEVTSSKVTAFFNGNLLSRIEGGNLPTETDYLARISGGAAEAKKSFKNVEIEPVVPVVPAPSEN